MKKNINLKDLGLSVMGLLLVVLLAVSFGASRAKAAITSQLSVGSSGSQVSALQQFLATNSFIYPSGLVTGYYGPLTAAAVSQFQLAYNLPMVGRVGPLTMGDINELMDSGLGLNLSAPIIYTPPTVQLVSGSATISWTTNKAATGKVVYSTSPIVLGNTFDTTGVNFTTPTVVSGTLAQYDSVARTSQSVTISGLTSGTTYYYLVISIDPSNNVAVTIPATFRAI